MYVYAPVALELLLGASAATLHCHAETFFRAIARGWLPHDHLVMPIIRLAFADYLRSAYGRTFPLAAFRRVTFGADRLTAMAIG